MAKQTLPTKKPAPPSRGVAPIDPSFREIFGAPPLYPDENEEDFNRLHELLRKDIIPTDAIEEILVKDLADQIWERQRLQRSKVNFMKVIIRRNILEILVPFEDSGDKILTLLIREKQGDAAAKIEINKLLEEFLSDRSEIAAEETAKYSSELDSFDSMISVAANRRDQILARIERHRNGIGRLREPVVDIEEGEYSELTQGAKR